MAQDDGQERTEQPTEKRLNEARERGQLPRSRELNTFAVLLASGLGLLFLGESIVGQMARLFRDGMQIERGEIFDPVAMWTRLIGAISDALLMLAPFFGLLVVVALLAPAALGGVSFSAKALAVRLDKLDPVKGLGRVFGWKGLVEMLKALAKFAVIAFVALLLLRFNLQPILGLMDEPLEVGLAHSVQMLTQSFLLLAAAMLIIACADVPFQLWDHRRQLKMTRQEIRDEHKETEGSPEVRGRVRNVQRELARRRMMQEVPKADVVITNPTHFAVALKYDQAKMGAPVVVAKGADLVAGQIRSIAYQYSVSVLSAPPLARALYHSTKLNQQIPVGLYLAVAQVLAYVYQVRRHEQQGGPAPRPVSVGDLPIPDDLKRE